MVSSNYHLYWIKTPDMVDILTEGYVGITYNPDVRMGQHKSFARCSRRYPTEMSKALNTGYAQMFVQVIGTKDYCMSLERVLRPTTYIGWNRAIGGDGGVMYKHGLSGTKCKSSFYNLKDRATRESKSFSWTNVEEFASFYEEVWREGGTFDLLDEFGNYDEGNLICTKRSERLRKAQRSYILDGEYYSVSELADLSGEKPNTISTRLKRGWSVQEATYGR